MKYLKWSLLAIGMLLITILTYPVALVLPLFAENRNGKLDNGTKEGMGWYLPSWLSWFQTPDNDLDGDLGWRTEHWQWTKNVYLRRIGWLWRNPACGFGNVQMIGNPTIDVTYTGNKDAGDNPIIEGTCYVESQDLFQYVFVKRLTATKCFYVNLGWNLKGLINRRVLQLRKPYLAIFSLSIRIS